MQDQRRSDVIFSNRRSSDVLYSDTPFNSKLDLLKDSFVWDCIVSFANS